MIPFKVRYKDTGKEYVVLERSGPWWTIAELETGAIRGTKSLAGYVFVGFVARG